MSSAAAKFLGLRPDTNVAAAAPESRKPPDEDDQKRSGRSAYDAAHCDSQRDEDGTFSVDGEGDAHRHQQGDDREQRRPDTQGERCRGVVARSCAVRRAWQSTHRTSDCREGSRCRHPSLSSAP